MPGWVKSVTLVERLKCWCCEDESYTSFAHFRFDRQQVFLCLNILLHSVMELHSFVGKCFHNPLYFISYIGKYFCIPLHFIWFVWEQFCVPLCCINLLENNIDIFRLMNNGIRDGDVKIIAMVLKDNRRMKLVSWVNFCSKTWCLYSEARHAQTQPISWRTNHVGLLESHYFSKLNFWFYLLWNPKIKIESPDCKMLFPHTLYPAKAKHDDCLLLTVYSSVSQHVPCHTCQ